MKPVVRNLFLFLLCLGLFLILIPAAFAATGSVHVYDSSVITGFEAPDYAETVNTDYKYALIELRKEFPAQLTVRLGGKVSYQEDKNGSRIISGTEDYTTRAIDVTWKCREDYDEDLDVFHFFPDLGGYKLAEGLELPVITVNNLDLLPIPPLMDLPEDPYHWVPIPEEGPEPKAALPSYYNAYEKKLLPDIRDQNPYGTCWAHATLAGVEADLIHDGKASTSIDLSELHLIYFTHHNFYDEKKCNTGDTVNVPGGEYLIGQHRFVASMRLFNLLGPVPEADAPYSLNYSYKPSASQGRKGSVQVTDVYYLDKNDRNAIKNAILNHGAVTIDFAADKKYYSAEHNSFYCPEDIAINHAVALVGWDDNFSKSNFRAGTPEGNGAWLIRNSWGGTGYTYHSYFWMSYYDKSLDNEALAYDAELWRYEHVYSYDNSPHTTGWTYNSGTTASQKFHVDEGEQIEAIGFYTEYPITGIRFTLISGNRTVNKTVSSIKPGYHVIPLSSPFQIQKAADVTVQYKLTNSNDTFYAPTERSFNYDGFKYSYSAQCGSGLLLNGINKGADARIKLFTNDAYDLILPTNLTTIGNQAFYGGSFKSVKLPDKTVSIGRFAFANCSNLKRIYIPKATTQIDDNAFGTNTNLIIEGARGSTAESYASSHGFIFRAVN